MTLHLTMFADLSAFSRKVWLVKGLLGDGEFSCIFGPPGSGKSVLVGDLAAHVAANLPWFGRKVAGGSVLYVAAERAALVKRRFIAFRDHHNLQDLPLGVLEGAIDLRSSKSAEEIAEYARNLRDNTGQNVRLVIIDTTSRALAGGDENGPKDMGALITNVAAIQIAIGAHVLLVHHIPTDGTQRLRGHGALLGAVDTTIGVAKFPTHRTATVDKQNDGEEGETVAFTLESVEIAPANDDEEATTAPVVVAFAGPIATVAASRKLSDRQRNALETLADLCLDGQPLPPSFALPNDIRAVDVSRWREELFTRGFLDKEAKNPRSDFHRLKESLCARHLIAQKENLVWKVTKSAVASVAP